MTSPGAPLVVERVSKTFHGVRVVDSVSLVVDPGTVRALVGGNGSGKSTLLKMLAGVYHADPGGLITCGGTTHPSERFFPAHADRAGLRFVHQDLGLVDDLSIAENVAIATGYPRRLGFAVSWPALDARARAAMAAVGLDRDPRTRVGVLRPSERALLAIGRALVSVGGSRACTLVLDEPTASLPHDQVADLLAALGRLRDEGHAVVFVSHRLSEVLELADVVTVLRDGAVVADGPVADFDEATLLNLLAGPRGLQSPPPRKVAAAGGPSPLRVEDFRAGPVTLDLELRRGEIVGVAGLVGSGRTSLLRGLFGDLPSSGRMWVGGVPVRPTTPRLAMAAGIAMVPEDRARDAAFLDRPVWQNVSAAVLRDFRRRGRLDQRTERREAEAAATTFLVRARSGTVPFGTLSGGNQQKAVLARWLRRRPEVLLLDEPSQGVDAAARADIHALVRDQVRARGAALVVSSDVEELEALCDRVVVLHAGRVVAELSGPDLTAARIIEITQLPTQEAAA